MSGFIGVNDKSKEITSVYLGVNNKAKEITSVYWSVDGKARLAWTGEEDTPDIVGYYSNGKVYSVNLRTGERKELYSASRLGTLPDGGWYNVSGSKINFYKKDGTINFSVSVSNADTLSIQSVVSKDASTSDYFITYYRSYTYYTEDPSDYYLGQTSKAGKTLGSYYVGDGTRGWGLDRVFGFPGRSGEFVWDMDRSVYAGSITSSLIYQSGSTSILSQGGSWSSTKPNSGTIKYVTFATSKGLVLSVGHNLYGDPNKLYIYSNALSVPWAEKNMDSYWRLPYSEPYDRICESFTDGSIYFVSEDQRKVVKYDAYGNFKYYFDLYEQTGLTLSKIFTWGGMIYGVSGNQIVKIKDMPKVNGMKWMRNIPFEGAGNLSWLYGHPSQFMPYYKSITQQ